MDMGNGKGQGRAGVVWAANAKVAGAWMAAAIAVQAWATDRGVATFSTSWDVGLGNAVFVVGGPPELGGWNPARAIRLKWNEGNHWLANVEVPTGVDVFYKFICKPADAQGYCDAARVVWAAGSNEWVRLDADGPGGGKSVRYSSGLKNVGLHYADGAGWKSLPMADAGEGLAPGERLYRLDGVSRKGQPMEFVFFGTDAWGAQVWDKPAAVAGGEPQPNYSTPADAIWVRNGQVYTYAPSAQVEAGTVVTTRVASSVSGISSRRVRIYLPRGYGQNVGKRYPVVYMHDGQAVFQPGNEYGCWNAERNAEREIGQGRMRECLIVAVDNVGQERIWEYLPPMDSLAWMSGRAAAYAAYLVGDVKALVDARYRTLPAREHTAVLGSSMGGLVSAYAAFETDSFGHAGAMSPAFSHSPRYSASLKARPKQDVRFYLDWGTNEDDGYGGDYWNAPASVYDAFVGAGCALHKDLEMQVGCGHAHNEWAWDQRLPHALRFLMDIRAEAAGTPDEEPSPWKEWEWAAGATSGFFEAFRAAHANLRMADPAWGLWAHGGETAVATREFAQALPAGSSFEFRMQNNWIRSGGAVGWALENAGGETLLEMVFAGGESTYRIRDAAGERATALPWTDAGHAVRVEALADGAYRLSVAGQVFAGRLDSSADPAVRRVAFWNADAGAGEEYNVYFGEFAIHRDGQTSWGPPTGASPAAPTFTMQPADVGGGISLRWSSEAGQRFVLEKSVDLRAGFAAVAGGEIEATPPANTYVDPDVDSTPGPRFYRLRLAR
jgi:predicted alpha/beta superfamily hydrolase